MFHNTEASSIPRRLFYRYQAQTSDAPLALEIVRASGIYMYDLSGKKYVDLISGISVSNIGHSHPRVVAAIAEQAARYMHLMVYGEYVQTPTVELAEALCKNLPSYLDNVYFTNSGAEATEAAMKLVKRATGKPKIASMRNAYHGSTQGALSIIGDEGMKQNFRPLLPGTYLLRYNEIKDLELIDEYTAAVFVEPIQAEAGVVSGSKAYMQALSDKCREVGALLVLDEIQTGFGRCGTMFYLEQMEIEVDIVLLAKGLGAGMPIGALVAQRDVMQSFTHDPVLGHITTFGGNAVCAAAALAGIKVIEDDNLLEAVMRKSALFQKKLSHAKIKALRAEGLLIAVEFESFEMNKKIIDLCIEKGVVTDWFLFAAHCMRIAPPLIITEEEIQAVCDIILQSINEAYSR